jgi:hypothetical protein
MDQPGSSKRWPSDGKTRRVFEGAIHLPSDAFDESAIVINTKTGEARYESGRRKARGRDRRELDERRKLRAT